MHICLYQNGSYRLQRLFHCCFQVTTQVIACVPLLNRKMGVLRLRQLSKDRVVSVWIFNSQRNSFDSISSSAYWWRRPWYLFTRFFRLCYSVVSSVPNRWVQESIRCRTTILKSTGHKLKGISFKVLISIIFCIFATNSLAI